MPTGLDKIYINFDTGVSGALLRIILGILLVLVVGDLSPAASPWTMTAYLLVLLFAIKVFASVARKAVAPSSLVRSHWEWRRNLARYYDSFQWRKLLWFGIGILLAGALRWPETRTEWIVGLSCVVAGAAAEVFWRRLGLSIAPPAR